MQRDILFVSGARVYSPGMTAARVGLHKTFNLDQHVAIIAKMVQKSLRDGESRRLALRIVSGAYDYAVDPRTGKEVPVIRAYGKDFLAPTGRTCKPHDARCEMEKIWDFVVLNARYVYDTAGMDVFATVKETLLSGGGDCFPEGTLLLQQLRNGTTASLVPVEQLQAGAKIWGRDRWSEVTRVWSKGELPVTAIRMNNGSWLHLTEDHKVYVGVCKRHTERPHSAPCQCPIEEREVVRIPVSELATSEERPEMILLQPSHIETTPAHSLPNECAVAELFGLYLADGWSEETRFAIAGKDGHPKEEQKRRVVALCEQLGIETSWTERYVRVRNPELTQVFSKAGTRAFNKKLHEIPLSADRVAALLRGLMADSGANTHGKSRTYGSTSYELAVATRVLHRMLGVACGWATIERHGGLGTHPMHRLYVRADADTKVKGQKLLRVKEIHRNVETAPCWDISTDDHYVYLPEHDVTVSNCDDLTILFATLLKHLGFEVIARVVSTKDNPEQWVHIYPLCGLPKDNPTQWVPLDTTVDGSTPGWEYRDIAHTKDYVL